MSDRQEASIETRWLTTAVDQGGRALLGLVVLLLPNIALADDSDRPSIITVVGAPGLPEYGGSFRDWADRWQGATKKAGAALIRIGLESPAAKDEKPGKAADKGASASSS